MGLDAAALADIERPLADCIRNPVGPAFVAPPQRLAA
jgi:hypothetical protein